MPEFRKYPSIPRYRKNIQITEKIDGMNAAIVFLNGKQALEAGISPHAEPYSDVVVNPETGAHVYVRAQSRNCTLSIRSDSHGFAKWVHSNAEFLFSQLGYGYHYGEWWGSGVGRNYGMPKGKKIFTLFNPDRYSSALLDTVPVLYNGPALIESVDQDTGRTVLHDAVDYTMLELKRTGSRTPEALGYLNPEGVVVFHTASRSLYKVTYEHDEGKWTSTKK